MASRTPVGVIGVGLMGEVYARRLVAAGFTVIGFDVDPAKNARLAQIGARAGTLADIAHDCDPIVLAVFNTDQVEDVVEHALIPAAAGKIVLVHLDLRSGSHRGTRRARRRQTALSGNAGVGHERAGPPGRRRRPDRRRSKDRGRRRAGARRAVSPSASTSARSATAAAPSSRSISSSASTAWRSPKVWSLRRPARARSGGVPRRRAPLGRGFAGHGHQGTENDRRRFCAGRPRAPDAQGHAAHARSGAQGRPELPLLQIHADVLEACVRHGDSEQDNSIVIEEIRRRVL